jgi:hypothetical protein
VEAAKKAAMSLCGRAENPVVLLAGQVVIVAASHTFDLRTEELLKV